MKDKLFQVTSAAQQKALEEEFKAGFVFNERVAAVFDDMAKRSIPFYKEVVALLVQLSHGWFEEEQQERVVYDLGCSTGTCLLALRKHFRAHSGLVKRLELIGIDRSKPMLAKAREKLRRQQQRETSLAAAEKISIRFYAAELAALTLEEKTADFILLNYTLQFLPPSAKMRLLKKIYLALKPKGGLLLSEKVTESSTAFTALFNALYFNFKKKKKYTRLEIERKRAALLKQLTPQSYASHCSQLRKVGFEEVSLMFKWCNFASFLARKAPPA